MLGNDIYTKLLLHGGGDDASTTITDSSASGHTVTATNGAQVDTAQKKFGTGSILFDGTNDYLSIPDSADWYLGTDNFTVDFWARFNALPAAGSYQVVFNQAVDSGNYVILYFHETSGNIELVFEVLSGSATTISIKGNTSGLTTNTWNHFAVVRNGTVFSLYQNGAQIGSGTDADTIANLSAALIIGRYNPSPSLYFNGWIDEFRWSKGVARTDFIPVPTEEYSDSIVALPFTSTSFFRLAAKVISEPLISISSLGSPVITGVVAAVLIPASMSVTGELTSSGEIANSEGEVTFPAWQSEATTGATAVSTFPEWDAEAQAFNVQTADCESTFPEWESESLSGAITSASLSLWSCESTASIPLLAQVDVSCPEWSCDTTAMVEIKADVDATTSEWLCSSALTVTGVANGSFTFPEWSVSAAATVETMVAVECDFPEWACESGSYLTGTNNIDCTLPAWMCDAVAKNPQQFHNKILQYSRW